MTCPACGRENRQGAAFCRSCGAALASTCPSCRADLLPGSRFCDACGHRIADVPASRLPERDPRDYTPKHLAEKILQSKSALEGERKQVTVLFADVKGSLALSEQVDPEEWHAILVRVWAFGALGLAGLLDGRWREALDALGHAREIGRESRAGLWLEAQILARLARAQLGLDDPATARVTAEEAIAMARRRATQTFEIEGHLVLGRALLQAGARREVETALDAALCLVEETGAKGYLPFVHLERAALARASGDEAARRRELREAHGLFTAMGAPIRAAQVEHELAA